MIGKGIIISIQKYSTETIEELAANAANGGAVAIRTDKQILSRLPLIGLKKIKVAEPEKTPYITPTLEAVRLVENWTKIIAVDFRRINPNLKEISDYAREKQLTIVADIGEIEDYRNINENDYYHSFVASTFRVFHKAHYPDMEFLRQLVEDEECDNLIAEGNIQTRKQILDCYKMGIRRICIGSAVSCVYKLTKKYTSVRME